jgi:PIN domain nuclease of toxin-antitoxin system
LPSRPAHCRRRQTTLSTQPGKLANLTRRIALEAAQVPSIFGRGDPGDCSVIATAHVKRIPIVTRDHQMLRLAQTNPHYLTVIRC